MRFKSMALVRLRLSSEVGVLASFLLESWHRDCCLSCPLELAVLSLA